MASKNLALIKRTAIDVVVAPTHKALTLTDRRLACYEWAERADFVRITGATEIDDTSQDNIRLALTKLGYEVGYDEFADITYVSAAGGPAQPIDDAILHDLWLRVDAAFGFRPTLDLFTIVLNNFARQFAHHAVREYLDGLEWDGTPRLDKWLITYAGAEDTEFNRAVGAIALIAAVRRVRQPGCKFDELPVLQGDQGDGKSTLVKELSPVAEWFSDSLHLGDNPKQTIENSRGLWIAELSELVGRGREVEQIKAFLSRHVDGPVRLAWGRTPVRVPRQFVAIGTTNSPEFLKDTTGNRRFWPVATKPAEGATTLDIKGIIRDRDQLWAEAAEREAKGESIRLPEHLWAEAAKVQEQFRQRHPWEEAIEEKLGLRTNKGHLDATKKAVAVSAVWAAVGVRDTARQDNRNGPVISGAMRRLGFVVKKKVRITGQANPIMCWVRNQDATRFDAEDAVLEPPRKWIDTARSKK